MGRRAGTATADLLARGPTEVERGAMIGVRMHRARGVQKVAPVVRRVTAIVADLRQDGGRRSPLVARCAVHRAAQAAAWSSV